jgi:peptidyl-prolyl cis-trans isomerase A (cyclophilin A)
MKKLLGTSLAFAQVALVVVACGPVRGPNESTVPVLLPPPATSATTEPAHAPQPAKSDFVTEADLPPTVVATSGPDPTGGHFTLAEATAGMVGNGTLVATIRTSEGDLRCDLYEDRAPLAVASFVGLARGTRPWKDPATGKWVKRRAYDGTTFHRVVKGYMIHGGDPNGDGTGDPGYVFNDEIWPGSKHDRPGLLCTVNRGPNTNGAQFFVTDARANRLDGNYTIFGDCSPVDVVHAIASVPVGFNGHPQTPVTISRVDISREH